MAKGPEVRAKLSLEDFTSTVLEKISAGFEKTQAASETTQHSVTSFAKDFASHFAAINLVPAVQQVYDFGKELFHAGMEAQNADQAIAGLIAGVQGSAWQVAHDKASQLGDDLDEIAVKAMQATSDVGAAFETLVEISGATEQGLSRSKNTTKDLATIANVLGGSAQVYAQQFGFAAEGAIKTKSALFQLLQPTGIFGDSVKKASAYWASITEESRIKLLEYGVGQIANRLSAAEPTMGDLLTTLQNMAGIAKEKFGEEIVKAVLPEIKSFVDELTGAREQIDGMAEGMGRKVGEYVRDAAREVRKGFEYIRSHYAEIKETIVIAFNHAKEVVTWILGHKEEIAVAFGAKTSSAPIKEILKGAGAGLDIAAKGVPGLGIKGTGGGLAMGAATVTAFAAAVATWSLAIDEWRQLMAITEGGKSQKEQDFEAKKRFYEAEIAAPKVGAMGEAEIGRYEKLRASFVALAEETGQNSRAAGELADRAWDAHRAARKQVEGIDEVSKVFREMEAAGTAEGADVSKAAAAIDATFNTALKANNDNVQKYVANVLLGSKSLQNAFLLASDLTLEGFEAMARLVEGKSKEFAAKIRETGEAKQQAATPAKPEVVFNNAQITIKQDFRDQDPDRVYFAFKQDLARASVNRTQARTGTAFGG